jgi:hypothetical protein
MLPIAILFTYRAGDERAIVLKLCIFFGAKRSIILNLRHIQIPPVLLDE